MLAGLCQSLRWGAPASIPSAATLLPLLLLLTPAAAHPIPEAAEDDPRRDLSKEFMQEKVNIVVARYELYTTTWTETETYTSTYTSGGPAVATGTCTPAAGSGEIACGNVCCGSWQYCAYLGQCLDNPGVVGATGATTTFDATPTETPVYFTTYTSAGHTVTTPYNPPYKATSGSGSATGTALGSTGTGTGNVSSTTSGNQLSGGAIAGIVIGTLAGVALLIGLCACVLVRDLWNGILAILGLGKRRDRGEDVTIIEEETYRRHSDGRQQQSSWYGGGGGVRPPPPMSEKKKIGNGWLGLGAAAATLLVLLGLKRHEDHKNEERRRPPRSRSEVSSDMYSYSYMSGSRESRRSRGTRASRRSDPTRVSRSSRPSRQPRRPSRAPSQR